MTGYVDGRQPKLTISIRVPDRGTVEIEFVVDTGLEGALTIPAAVVSVMGLPFYQRIRANLADDSVRRVAVHKASVLWRGEEWEVPVLAMGARPLVRTALLDGHELCIRFEDRGRVALDPL